MDINKFRIIYSELIENYQFIEMHLKGIYALLNTDASIGENAGLHIFQFYENITAVHDDCLNAIVKKIKEQEKKKNKPVCDDLTYNRLEELRARRNYWCHSCFTDMVFDIKTAVPKKKHIDELLKDHRESEELRALLFEIKMQIYS